MFIFLKKLLTLKIDKLILVFVLLYGVYYLYDYNSLENKCSRKIDSGYKTLGFIPNNKTQEYGLNVVKKQLIEDCVKNNNLDSYDLNPSKKTTAVSPQPSINKIASENFLKNNKENLTFDYQNYSLKYKKSLIDSADFELLIKDSAGNTKDSLSTFLIGFDEIIKDFSITPLQVFELKDPVVLVTIKTDKRIVQNVVYPRAFLANRQIDYGKLHSGLELESDIKITFKKENNKVTFTVNFPSKNKVENYSFVSNGSYMVLDFSNY